MTLTETSMYTPAVQITHMTYYPSGQYMYTRSLHTPTEILHDQSIIQSHLPGVHGVPIHGDVVRVKAASKRHSRVGGPVHSRVSGGGDSRVHFGHGGTLGGCQVMFRVDSRGLLGLKRFLLKAQTIVGLAYILKWMKHHSPNIYTLSFFTNKYPYQEYNIIGNKHQVPFLVSFCIKT